MHVPTVSVRFGLMLEAYCRGCGEYRRELSVQLGALTKMEQVGCSPDLHFSIMTPVMSFIAGDKHAAEDEQEVRRRRAPQLPERTTLHIRYGEHFLPSGSLPLLQEHLVSDWPNRGAWQ